MDQIYNPFGFLLPGLYLSLLSALNVSGYMSARRNWRNISLWLSLVPLLSSIAAHWGCFPVLLPIMLLFLLSILDCLPPCPVYKLPLTQHLPPRLYSTSACKSVHNNSCLYPNLVASYLYYFSAGTQYSSSTPQTLSLA